AVPFGGKQGMEASLRAGTYKTVLQRGVIVRGKVTDQRDRPVADANVSGGSQANSARTDEQGSFSLRNIKEGETPFTIVAKSYKPEVKSVTVKTDMPELVFKLSQGNVVRGIVQNEAGEPIAGVRFVLMRPRLNAVAS